MQLPYEEFSIVDYCPVLPIGVLDEMEFYLTYEGPLPADAKAGIVRVKHEIRKAMHVQLQELWEGDTELTRLAETKLTSGLVPLTHREECGRKYGVGEFHFVPLIMEPMKLLCALDILFLRREKPGMLITKPKDEYGGDLDNRLKTFLDALRVPKNLSELPPDSRPDEGESPFFYCLLEDDSLVTKIQIDGQRLLRPTSCLHRILDKDAEKEVRIILKVITKITVLTMANMPFLQG